jgi:small subunit ribosomal protein S13
MGLGGPTARRVLTDAQVDPNKRVKAWSEEEVARIRDIIERELKVEGDLRREVSMNVKRLMDIGAYRGIRHRRGLPVRGQRTHTNSRTRKGPRKGVMIKKKPTAAAPAPEEGTRSVTHGRRETRATEEGRQEARAA